LLPRKCQAGDGVLTKRIDAALACTSNKLTFSCVVFATPVTALTLICTSLTRISLKESLLAASAGVCAMILMLCAWYLSKEQKKRGHLLLDCSPTSSREGFLLNAILIAFIGTGVGLLLDASGKVGEAACLVPTLSCSLFWLLASTGRFQIVDNGIWQYWSLLSWHRIVSYEWHGDSSEILILNVATAHPSLEQCFIIVPPIHRNAVSDLLRHHVTEATLQNALNPR
jgi:hypothetical protein